MNQIPPSEWLENVTFDEMVVGQSARLLRTLSTADIQAFAAVSGDTNPTHLNSDYANDTLFHGVIAHGMWGGALISTLLGTEFPGPGTIYLSQTLKFKAPVRPGDTVTATVTVKEVNVAKNRVTLDTVCTVAGKAVIEGESLMMPPARAAAPGGTA